MDLNELTKLTKLNIESPFANIQNIVPQVPSYIQDMTARNKELLSKIRPIDEVLEKELEPIVSSNQLVIEALTDNYNKLDDLYKLKEKELEDAKTDNKKLKTYNAWMLVITILSMLAAMASWIIPLFTGGGTN